MSVEASARAAKTAGKVLASLAGDARSALLQALAAEIEVPSVVAAITEANRADLERARIDETAAPLVARLELGRAKLADLAHGLRHLASMPEVVGRRDVHRELDTGLVLERRACPLGTVGVVFEARPDAVIQIAGIAWKSGNALLLKGGSEAKLSNRALVRILREVLERHRVPADAVGLLEERRDVDALIRLRGLVDLVIARGSNAFVKRVRENATVPVMGHDAGLCHVFLHRSADPGKAVRIVVDAKCSYPAACNAAETLLFEPGAEAALDAVVQALVAQGVRLRACPDTRARHPGLEAATDTDFDTEHGALVMGVRRVADLDDALRHVEQHGSRHTEAIVAEDAGAAERFLREVDAASVFVNASTRFADGHRFGLGAEVGISTDKLHARGPVGVEGLLTYRWLLRGDGHASADYGEGRRPFRHLDL